MKPLKFICLTSLLLMVQLIAAQNKRLIAEQGDHLFVPKKGSMILVATGIPYIGISEYSYGISNRTTVGAVIGHTPDVPGYGIRIRSILFQKKQDFRVYIRVPIFYYPRTKEIRDQQWFLTWPTVNSEWILHSGIRITAGGGVVAAACADGLFGSHEEDHGNKIIEMNHEMDFHNNRASGFMGLWNTIQMGMALPINSKMMFQAEAALVMKGLEIAPSDWMGGPPVILTLGVSYSL